MSDENVDLNFVNMPNRELGSEGDDRAPLLDNEDDEELLDCLAEENPELATPSSDNPSEIETQANVSKWSVVSIIILTFVNLLNYMDRYSIAGQSDRQRSAFAQQNLPINRFTLRCFLNRSE